MRREWNHSEIDILRQNYSSKTIAEMRQLLPDRSSMAINHEASRLGIPKSSYFWNQEELDILRANWEANGRPKLLSLLPLKDWSSIRHKAYELGLTKKAFAKYWRTYTKTPKIILSDVERGYLAGLIDGEGTIRVRRALKKWYAPFIQITNTNKAMMDWLEKVLISKGIGHLYSEKRSQKKYVENPQYRTKHVCNIASVQGVKQVLEQTIDILTTKKKQAVLVMEFIKMKEEKADYGILAREQEIFEELKRLNARGRLVE